jgi:isoquinoline 1-oxidoreductase beta subunit
MQRRSFIKSTGGLILGFVLHQNGFAETETLEPNAWVRIDRAGDVTVLIEKADFGQGAWTALAMILAEELEADWAKVRLEQAPTIESVYQNTLTGGSSSVRKSWAGLRQAGAQAREMLVAAAADQWRVPKSSCRAEHGAVIHQPTQRRLLYGELVDHAARMPLLNMDAVPLKDPKQFRLIGKPLPKKDVPAKVNGTARFGIDVRVPGMVYAVIARCPTFGGKPVKFDAAEAKAAPGVIDVVEIPPLAGTMRTSGGIAVIAEHTWAAIQGREALKIEWDRGPHARESSASLRELALAQFQKPPYFCAREEGEFTQPSTGAKTIQAIYELPFQAHATMEPMNCTADVRADRIEMWVGTQFAGELQKLFRELSGLPAEKVIIHNESSGGAFGRRALWDYPAEAWQVSKAVNKPVKLVWTREDDLQHDFFRQLSYQKMRADPPLGSIGWLHLRPHRCSILPRYYVIRENCPKLNLLVQQKFRTAFPVSASRSHLCNVAFDAPGGALSLRPLQSSLLNVSSMNWLSPHRTIPTNFA